ILKELVQYGDAARNSRVRITEVQYTPEAQLKLVEARARFENQFDSVVSVISVDHRLSTQVHDQFNELWMNLRDMKKIAEVPGELGGRSWDRRKAQLTEATYQHDRILESLRLELGFK
ncbi:MAG TPA: hypothetical protein VGH74_17780, partial [Planctomycetaceae bacterium]